MNMNQLKTRSPSSARTCQSQSKMPFSPSIHFFRGIFFSPFDLFWVHLYRLYKIIPRVLFKVNYRAYNNSHLLIN